MRRVYRYDRRLKIPNRSLILIGATRNKTQLRYTYYSVYASGFSEYAHDIHALVYTCTHTRAHQFTSVSCFEYFLCRWMRGTRVPTSLREKQRKKRPRMNFNGRDDSNSIPPIRRFFLSFPLYLFQTGTPRSPSREVNCECCTRCGAWPSLPCVMEMRYNYLFIFHGHITSGQAPLMRYLVLCTWLWRKIVHRREENRVKGFHTTYGCYAMRTTACPSCWYTIDIHYLNVFLSVSSLARKSQAITLITYN